MVHIYNQKFLFEIAASKCLRQQPPFWHALCDVKKWVTTGMSSAQYIPKPCARCDRLLASHTLAPNGAARALPCSQIFHLCDKKQHKPEKACKNYLGLITETHMQKLYYLYIMDIDNGEHASIHHPAVLPDFCLVKIKIQIFLPHRMHSNFAICWQTAICLSCNARFMIEMWCHGSFKNLHV